MQPIVSYLRGKGSSLRPGRCAWHSHHGSRVADATQCNERRQCDAASRERLSRRLLATQCICSERWQQKVMLGAPTGQQREEQDRCAEKQARTKNVVDRKSTRL